MVIGASRPDSSATDLVRAFSALQVLMVAATGVEEFLTDLAALAARVVDPPGSCGITVRRDGPLTIASSDDRAELIDEAQYGSGTGPCLDSLASGAVIDVPDLAADTRWPEFRHRALANGVHASLSVPLTDGPDRIDTIGALNLYGLQPHAFDAAARLQAQTFAAQASTALVLVLRTTGQAEQSAQLEQALSSRTEIDQAIGILMGQQRCTADEAFVLLRRHSQNNNRKLREVAVDLIMQVSGHSPVPGPGFRH